EDRPSAGGLRIYVHHPSSKNGRAPRVAIDSQLGQVTMRKHPRVALGLGVACELGEHRQHLVGIERVAQRPLDISPKGVDVLALCSLAHISLIAAPPHLRNGVLTVFRSTVVRT